MSTPRRVLEPARCLLHRSSHIHFFLINRQSDLFIEKPGVQKKSFWGRHYRKAKSLTDLIGWLSANERTTAISNRPIYRRLMGKRLPAGRAAADREGS